MSTQKNERPEDARAHAQAQAQKQPQAQVQSPAQAHAQTQTQTQTPTRAQQESSSDNAFVRYAQSMRDPIDSALIGTFALPVPPEEKAFLYRPLENFIAAGGKRLRPVLVCLAAEASGANPFDALPAAAALELFQTAALIHDDIADQSQTRRGLPCLHLKEGTGMALNQGDLALIESFASVAENGGIEPALAIKLLQELCQMERHTAEGQALDLGWVREDKWDVKPQDYLRMATLKTAWYTVASPLVLGALFGSDAIDLEALRNYGLNLGLAFQIVDDVLNLKGDATELGKDFRSDLTEGKRTLLTTYALQHLDESKKQELLKILSARTHDAAALAKGVDLLESSGAFAYANNTTLDLLERAETFLANAHLSASEAKNALESLAPFITSRTY